MSDLLGDLMESLMLDVLTRPRAGAPGASSSPDASELARVTSGRSAEMVSLPPGSAARAVARFLADRGSRCEIVEGPASLPDGTTLSEREWAVLMPASDAAGGVLAGGLPRRFSRNGVEVLARVYPRHKVGVPGRCVSDLRLSLEFAKGENLDERGLPLPWVPPDRTRDACAPDPVVDDDALIVPASQPLPPPASSGPPVGILNDDELQDRFRPLCRLAGLAPIELEVRHISEDRRGFVTGRVWMDAALAPRRVTITTCPNSDLAEALATMAHELAHPLSRSRAHEEPFRRALVDFASRAWGGAFFAGARLRIEAGYRTVDKWVAAGIRAALLGREPPMPKTGDDGQTARVVSKLAKLRALAADQAGRPEAVAATAQANDIATIYGIEGIDVLGDDRIAEQMVDRWVALGKAAVWRRELAHGVAAYCNVFSLSMSARARMHFFGRYADVVAAEYLFNISSERIERDCAAHMEHWRAHCAPVAGEARTEAVDFCDSAALAFRRKLEEMKREEAARARAAPQEAEALAFRLTQDGLGRAERFAEGEYRKRGMKWRHGTAKLVFHNEAGERAGRAMQVVRGLDSRGNAPRQLPGRR